MADKNNVTLKFDIGINNREIQKNFNAALGNIKAFITNVNKAFSKMAVSKNETTSDSKEIKAMLKLKNDFVKPSSILGDGKTYSSLKKESDDATNSIVNNGDKIKNSNKKVKDSFSELQIVGIYGFRLIARKFRQAISDMSSAGAKLYELNSRFGLIFDELANKAEAFAEKLSNAYGINEATIKENMLKLYTLGQNAGFSNKKALELTKTMSRLGIEIASVWDVPIEEATGNLISALQGLPRAMKKYGSYVGTQEIKEFFNKYLTSKGMQPLTRELTRQEKVLGVYLKSLSDLGYSFGDFERTVTSTANQTKILQETLLTLKQIGGSLINTVLSPVLIFVNKILKTISNMAKSIQKTPIWLQKTIGGLMLFVLIVPSVIGSISLFLYYSTKMRLSLQSISEHLGKSSLRMIEFGKVATKVAGTIALIAGFIISLQMVIDSFNTKVKNSADNGKDSLNDEADAAKNLKKTLTSFDDVNIFSQSEGEGTLAGLDIDEYLESIGYVGDELTNLNDLFKESTILAQGLSIALLIIDSVGLIVNVIKNWKVFSDLLLKSYIWIQNNIQAIGAWSLIAIGVVSIIKSIVDIFNKWGDMSTGQRIVSIIMTIASAMFILAAAIAAIKGKFVTASILAGVGAFVAAGNSAIIGNIAKQNSGTTANNVGSNTNVVSSAYNNTQANDLGASISNAVMSGMSVTRQSGDNRPINISINVDEEYIYRSYNKVAKQNGVI